MSSRAERSVAKDLEYIHFQLRYVPEILPSFGRLDDNGRGTVLWMINANYQLSILNYQLIQIMENNKTLWSKILNILITVLTAIATTFTTTSCIDML